MVHKLHFVNASFLCLRSLRCTEGIVFCRGVCTSPLPCQIYTVSEKRDRLQHFGCDCDKFRQLFIIFGTNHTENTCD